MPRPPRTRSDLVVAIALGAVFGVLVRLGDDGSGAVPWIVNIGGPWLVLAFVVGRWAPDRPARTAVAALGSAVVAKYVVQVGQHEIGAASLAARLVAWGCLAVVVGTVLGVAGAADRRGAAWAPAALGLPLVAEALAFLTRLLHGESAQLRYHGQPAGTLVFGLELAAGAAALVVASRRSRRA
jgi:hypothetical protein